jgi:hypothetical protein
VYNPNNSGDGGDMRYCKVPLATPTVHQKHPYRNPENHELLLQYLRARLTLGKHARDQELSRLVRIDKNVSGWMKLSDEDKKRDQKKERDGTPVATAMSLPLSFVHLDDMMTYFAQTFAPNRGMFYHTGKPDETSEALQIVTLMNNHAIYAGYFREVLLTLFSLLKYNRGGFHAHWAKESGPKIAGTGDATTVENSVQWQGNRLEAIDLYNHLCDPMVHPTKLHTDGEFSGVASLRSYYWLQQQAANGVYFNCNAALNEQKAGVSECKYYRNPPAEAQFHTNDSGGSGTNWVNVLSMAPEYANYGGFELVHTYIRINPTEFGLVEAKDKATRNRYEIWKLTLLNDQWIIGAEYMSNMHNYIPHFMGLLNDDLMGVAQKSVAEVLQPLQDFASFLMNIHVAGSRSAVWGTTFYDKSVIDLSQIPAGEVAANVAIKPAGQGKDIRNAIFKHNAELDTRQTMSDLESLMGIINQFFPTQSLPSQIASIDRAVSSQVAAVQQGTNRRQQKSAKLLDDTVFRNVRFALYYNIIQFQPDEQDVVDFFTGKAVKIDLKALRNTDLPFIIGQGLKALDRQAAADALQQIIFALIQAPAAAQEIDLLGLIDYWTSMIDIDMDMKVFYRQQVATGPGAGIGDNGGPPLEEGTAPIAPATNPQSITAPIYG